MEGKVANRVSEYYWAAGGQQSMPAILEKAIGTQASTRFLRSRKAKTPQRERDVLVWTLGESDFRGLRQRNSSTLPILAQPSQNRRVAGVIRRRPISSVFTTSWATRGQRLGGRWFGRLEEEHADAQRNHGAGDQYGSFVRFHVSPPCHHRQP